MGRARRHKGGLGAPILESMKADWEPGTSDYEVEVAAEYMLNMAHPDFLED